MIGEGFYAMNQFLIIRMAVVVVAVIGWTCVYGEVTAAPVLETPIIVSFSQEDIDGDGSPDLAIFVVDFAGNRYRVLAFDQGGDMYWSEDWGIGADFANDVWLFQTEAGDQTKLIIRLSQDSTGYAAELFDDVDDDQTVSYSISNAKQVDITESSFPTLRVTSQQPWLLPDGRINQFIQIHGYRPVLAPAVSFAVPYLPQDGRPTLEQETVDADGDGIADYLLTTIFPDAPSNWGFFRSAISINVEKQPFPGYGGFFLWPYLGQADPDRWQQNRRSPEDTSRAPILVDWQQARIRGITGMLPDLSSKPRWFFLSTIPVVKEQINELDWEQFAYFDFAGNPNPDMIVRLIRSGPAWTAHVGQRTLHVQQAAFSWHHTNLDTQQWDYKLELASPHELPSTIVPFKDFALREVPYEDLLSEYASRSWAYATFVAAESNRYESSEGIWEWGTVDGVILDIADTLASNIQGSDRAHINYLLGRSDSLPSQFYTDIRQGFRGEFGELNGPGRLYLSPVDRKLHLLGADTGVWNLGPVEEIRYKNLNGDAYLDQWTYNRVITGTHPYTITEQLMAERDHLIYNGQNTVIIRRTSMTPSLYETTPPRNREEWKALGQQLDAHRAEFASTDFLAMMRQFDGLEQQVEGATITDYRPIGDGGFRFVLELAPGFLVSGPDLLGLNGVEPGRYVVQNQNSVFTVAPFNPAQLSIDVRQAVVISAAPPLQITIDNTGSADALDLILVVEAESNGGRTIELARTSVQAPAGQTTFVPVDIPSTIAAGSTLRIRQEDSQGQVIATGEWAPLAGSAISNPTAIFGIQKTPILLPVIGTFAALIALAALLAATRRRGHTAA